MNVRIHVHFYAGFDDVFWSCNAGFCSPTPSVSSPPILPPLAEQKPSLHRQNTLFTKDHSYKNFQPLCTIFFLTKVKSSPRVLVIERHENIVKKAETRTFQMQVARFRSVQNSGRGSVLKLKKRKIFPWRRLPPPPG